MSGLVPAIYNGVRKLTTLTQAIYDSVSGGGSGDGTVSFDVPVVGTDLKAGDIVPFDGVSVSARRGRLVEMIRGTTTYAPNVETAVVAITSVLGGLTFVTAPTSFSSTSNRLCLTARLYKADGTRAAAADTSQFADNGASVSVCEHVVLSDNGVSAVVACFVWWYSPVSNSAYLGVVKYTITATSITINFGEAALLPVGNSDTSVSSRNASRFIAESASSVLLLGGATNAASTSMPTRRITLATSAAIATVASPTFSSISYGTCAATVHTAEGGVVILLGTPSSATAALLVTVSGGVATAVTPLTVTVGGAALSNCSWLRPQRGRYASRTPTDTTNAPVGYLASGRPAREITGNPAKNEWVLAYATESSYGTPAHVLFTLEGTTLVGTALPDLVFCADGAYRDATAKDVACVPYNRGSQFSVAVNGFIVSQFVRGVAYNGGAHTSYWLMREPARYIVPVEVVSISGGMATVKACAGNEIGHITNPDGVPIRAPSYRKGALLRTTTVTPYGASVTLTTRVPVFVEMWRVASSGGTASANDEGHYLHAADGAQGGGWVRPSPYSIQHTRELLGEALVLSDYTFASSYDAPVSGQTIKMHVYAAEV